MAASGTSDEESPSIVTHDHKAELPSAAFGARWGRFFHSLGRFQTMRVIVISLVALLLGCAGFPSRDRIDVSFLDKSGRPIAALGRIEVRSHTIELRSKCPSGDGLVLSLNLERFDREHLLYHCASNCFLSVGEWSVVKVTKGNPGTIECGGEVSVRLEH
jgi:hypothetical protein